MKHSKILVLATYPIEQPMHGGQKRTKAIVDTYAALFQEVRFVAIYHRPDFMSAGQEDIALADKNILQEIANRPYAADLITGESLLRDTEVHSKFKKLLSKYRPTVIQIEQIYLYRSVKSILAELDLNPKIILSSQNIETSMKQQIYADLELALSEQQNLMRQVTALEEFASRSADVVIAVSRSDAEAHRKIGAKKVITAPNGIDKIIPTAEAIKHWEGFKKAQGLTRLVVFVGSAHLPNLTGFKNMVSYDIKFLPQSTGLMLAGGISEYLQSVLPKDSLQGRDFWQRAIPLGKLSDDNLAGLIEVSDVILLPIVSGGGSNLKTAEAILSGKKIVSTSYAFRSYEKYLSMQNITIADSKEEFKAQIQEALEKPLIKCTAYELELAKRVQWSYCLEPLQWMLPIYLYGAAHYTVERVVNRLKRLLYRARRTLL